MARLLRSVCAALLAVGSAAAADAQTPPDTLPCDAWLSSIADGVTLAGDWSALYRMDACRRAASLVLATREQGVRTLLSRNDAGNAVVHISYLARDSAWVADSLVPLVLPTVADKSKLASTRGRLMLLLANKLRPRDAGVKAVYDPAPGQTPGTSGQCEHGMISGLFGGSALPQPAVNAIGAVAQAMVADSTEVPQLRVAALCLLRASNNPHREPIFGRPLRKRTRAQLPHFNQRRDVRAVASPLLHAQVFSLSPAHRSVCPLVSACANASGHAPLRCVAHHNRDRRNRGWRLEGPL